MIPKRTIFISHATSTDLWTSQFVEALKDAGYEVWFDQTHWYAKPGMSLGNLNETLRQNINTADAIIFIVTSNFARSEYTQAEILLATATGKRLIFVLRDEIGREGLFRRREIIDVIGLTAFAAAQRVIGALHVMIYDRLLQEEGIGQRGTQTVKVFISHSSNDKDFTRQLVNDLQERGASVWVDMERIPYGDFYKRINEGLNECNWFILVVTPSALESGVVEMEVNAAFGLVIDKQMNGIILIVATLYDTNEMPPLWRQLHRYDATTNYQTALTGVLKALELRQ